MPEGPPAGGVIDSQGESSADSRWPRREQTLLLARNQQLIWGTKPRPPKQRR